VRGKSIVRWRSALSKVTALINYFQLNLFHSHSFCPSSFFCGWDFVLLQKESRLSVLL
jgi:hypothetical protein